MTEFTPFVPSSSKISILAGNFVDDHGRILHLRGANVGSASKVPAQPRPKIHDHAQSSYVDQPFPLAEAPEHWARLKSWGLTFLRVNVTWDALEHDGPGEYDKEFLAYFRDLLKSLRGTGLVAYVSVHQDVWSRYCGGSGAPGWTLEAAGFDLSDDGAKLEASGAAYVGGLRGERVEGERGLWPTGYTKLACATMNTLFWGGETFAPGLKVGPKGVNIQSYLQDHFLSAFGALIDAVGDLDTVMGFEMMNEPHSGYIGLESIDEWCYETDLHLGHFPSPLQGFSLGAGHATAVPKYVRSFPYPTRVQQRVIANPHDVVAWSSSGPTAGKCPWEKEGVWKWSDEKKIAVALQEDYFAKDRKGRRVSFYPDFYFPFVKRWEVLVSKRAPTKTARFVEPLPNEFAPEWPDSARPKNFVFAPHWYDLHTMFNKKFGSMTVNVQGLSRGMNPLRALYFGKGVKKNYALQIGNIVAEARKQLGEVPVVFGECGIPMDMNYEEAFKTGNFKWQERMLDALISALESSRAHFNLWAYNPRNRDHLGDDWNSENFSWFSDEQRSKDIAAGKATKGDLDAGARLLDVLVRPYAIATSGTVMSSAYEVETNLFTHRYRETPEVLAKGAPPTSRVTEIYLPNRVYKEGEVKWTLTRGGKGRFDFAAQRLYVWFDDHVDTVYNAKGKEVHRRVDIWVKDPVDQRGWGVILVMIFLAVVATFGLSSELKLWLTGEGFAELNY
ncbi:hypothetical protein Q8F55_004103 [Vanrija albida]|uniref:Glycoside hydrolase family 5 C-terminal domain-containing protein n=1 Tax=Vanrija albida TaxID=181172 RepID=A0ABR3Q5T6_9TREE